MRLKLNILKYKSKSYRNIWIANIQFTQKNGLYLLVELLRDCSAIICFDVIVTIGGLLLTEIRYEFKCLHANEVIRLLTKGSHKSANGFCIIDECKSLSFSVYIKLAFVSDDLCWNSICLLIERDYNNMVFFP